MSQRESTEVPFSVPLPGEAPRLELDRRLSVDRSLPHTVEVEIPMRDGVLLAADVHFPEAKQLPAPTVVIGTPYDKTSPIDDGLVYRDAGYVVVVYDCRGRGKSEGEWYPYEHDGRDGHDVVEWAAVQSWCDGKVAAAGISYLGWIIWATMAERPPHLCAAISTAAAGRWQEELPYTYGCMWLYFAFWFSFVRRRITDTQLDLTDLLPTLPVDDIGKRLEPAGPGWQEMMEHDTLDDLWTSRRWDGRYDFDVPVLHVGGWHDREDIWGTFHHYENMLATSPAKQNQWLIVGPWSHISTRHPSAEYAGITSPGGAINMDAIHVRFFDRFLKGEENGVDQEPRVWMYDPGAKRWETRQKWEGGTKTWQAFLSAGSTLSESPGASGSESYRYDPMRPNGIPFDINQLPWEPPLDLSGLEAQEGVITWTGEPLGEDLTLHGWSEAQIWAASDCTDTEWHIKLADVDPEGQAIFVAWGCLRASYAEDPKNPSAIPPGVERLYSVELTPAFHTIESGHRIRLILASSEYPWFARNLNRFQPIHQQVTPRIASNTVYYGRAFPSSLRLSVET